MRVTIIGGGILGTAHALEAVAARPRVTHLEREVEARGATVRNFGLVWVSGRAEHELDAALRSRELWEQIGARIPGVGFRPAGSLTLLRTPREIAVAEQVAARADAEARGFEVLEPGPRPRAQSRTARQVPWRHCTVRATAPSNRGRPCPPSARTWRPPVATVPARRRGAVGRRHARARRPRPAARRRPGAGVPRRGSRWPDPRDRRRAAGAARPAADDADRPAGRAADHRDRRRRQLPLLPGLRGQRAGRAAGRRAAGLRSPPSSGCSCCACSGCTAASPSATPTSTTSRSPSTCDEAPYDYLVALVEEFLGRPLPPVRRRWAGVYSQCVDPGQLVYRDRRRATGVWVITGPGGRGMTLGPAIAEQTAELIDL